MQITSLDPNPNSLVSVRLTPSDAPRWDTCPRQVWYSDIRRVFPRAVPISDIFDHCLEDAVYRYLLSWKLRTASPGPVQVFEELWRESIASVPIQCHNPSSPDFLRRLGANLLARLPDAWERSQFDIVVDDCGEPIIKKPLRLQLGRRGRIDLEICGSVGALVQTPHEVGGCDLVLLEVTPITLNHGKRFARRSDHLTGCQLLVDSHFRRWGDRTLTRIGFWDFIKGRQGGRIADPLLVQARSQIEMIEYGEKLWWIAENVVRQRFSRTSREHFNCPCPQCPFVRHCLDEDATDLVFPTVPALAATA